MRRARFIASAVALVGAGLVVGTVPHASAASRQLISGGTTSLQASAAGDGGTLAAHELAPEPRAAEAAAPAAAPDSQPKGPKVDGVAVRPAGAERTVSFNGLNLRNQRLANGGNQFTLEPPDQGLCAGNGYVVESTNDVIRVFDPSGKPLTGVVDLNTFYGYPAEINRATGASGPFVTDPSCYFDPSSQRWFHVVLTLDTDPASGAFLGSNHLDLAVSTSASPLGSWRIYQLPVQDDGTQGTPIHGCALNADGTGVGPCIGDYPHLGVDTNGVYLTTNEYAFFGPGYIGAQIYAFSKAALVSGSTVLVNQFNTAGPNPGFTIWPASAPASANDASHGGTEYLMSGLVSSQPDGETAFASANRVAVWALTNTSSLNSSSPNVHLSMTTSETQRYVSPPRSDQKPGSTPLRECINDTTMATPFGPGCWQYLFVNEPAHDEAISQLDSNDGRMQQITYYNGRLYGSLDTAVIVQGADGHDHAQAGSAWFVVNPKWDGSKLSAETVNGGTLAVGDNNVNYPSIGVTSAGKAVMTFTLVGKDYFPSAAYVELRADGSTSAVKIAAAGVGPQDGFSGYKAFGNPPRPRWGDYGATAVVGGTVWVSSEYIAQSCSLTDYIATGRSCGGTRVTLGNWATRVSAITP